MSDSVIAVHARPLRDLLRLARELALQLDADTADDADFVEVQLLRAVKAVEAELAEDERPSWRDVRTSRLPTQKAER